MNNNRFGANPRPQAEFREIPCDVEVIDQFNRICKANETRDTSAAMRRWLVLALSFCNRRWMHLQKSNAESHDQLQPPLCSHVQIPHAVDRQNENVDVAQESPNTSHIR